MNLFMFPYAGGNKYSYNSYIPYLSEDVHMIALEPPGRGARTRESLITDLREMAEDLFQKIQPHVHEPYMFFGHSMGSWLAHLIVQRIKDAGLPLPSHLFYTGSCNPAYYRSKVIKYELSRADFFNHLADLGGISEEVLNNDVLLDYFEPVLRADFKAVELFRPDPTAPLDIPITVMIGNAEKNITNETARAWENETTAGFEMMVFDGNHFFINKYAAEISALVIDKARMYTIKSLV